jgi:hypothetical protein
VKVRVVVAERSNNHAATAAVKHRYADLADAGVEVWELPDTIVHTKSSSPTTSSASARSATTPGRSTGTRSS